MSLPPELVKKIKLLEIQTRKRVNNMFLGEYHSAFKGQGMTFSEFREYVPGDDVRSIAWGITARTGKTYVKKYDEEREMTVMIAVDVSGSQDFGSKQYFKGEVAAHVAALLSFAATGNKDSVGLLLFSDQVELYVPPKKGRGQVMRILRELYYHKPASRGTNLKLALEHLQSALKKKAHVFVISDFLDTGFEGNLRRLSKKHDTVAVVLEDKLELEIPKIGVVDFEDPETGELATVDTSSPVFKEYKAYLDGIKSARKNELRRSQVDTIDIRTDDDLVTPLLAFFQKVAAMTEVPVWSCLFSEAGTPLKELTVGAKFSMKCRGDIPVEWNKDPLKVTFAKPEESYSIAILKIDRLDSQDAEFTVTGYKPGPHKPEYIRILQGEKGFEVAKPEWEIQTVLKKGEPPQPFPQYGPFSVSFPLWILGAAIIVLGLIGYLAYRAIRRHMQRKRMLEDLQRHSTALSPLHQFYRDARALTRRLHNVKAASELKEISVDLEREFRLYVLRRFQIPTLDWSDSAIMRDLRKRHRKVFLRASDPLKKTLRELVRLRAQSEVLQKDIEQLHAMSLDAAEKLETRAKEPTHDRVGFLLGVFVLLPLAGLSFWIWYARRKHTATLQFSHLAGFLKTHRGYRAQLTWLPTAIKVVALALAIVALARPQRADTKIKRNVEGIDIVIVFDISDSMLIEDMEPENRMESAKQTMANFIKGRVSDRIGLVVFAGESYTRVPMTLDYPLLLRNLAEVEPARNIKMGTAIGVGLANGIARMKESTAKTRVVILMTDGENNSGTIDPETAIEIARGYGIKVYSIGMGRDGDAQLPVMVEDVFGRKVKRYRPIHSSVNDALLTKMAETTGGKYWRAITGDALKSAFKEIDSLEKTKIESSQFTRYAEMFPPYLRWAVLLYVLAVFVGTTVLRKGP